jgi:hypothetical protein
VTLSEDTSCMVNILFFTLLDFFKEYFGLYVVPFFMLGLGLGSGLGSGLGFMCAHGKQKYDGHIHLQ